ncbi:hypothetical protein HY642_05425 [Candidatus Woesearchaeota archaeon]|nr:hypothetical protein [Candidatus Woesearchaeota archaeon]
MAINDEVATDLDRFVDLLNKGTKEQQDTYLGSMRAKYEGQKIGGKPAIMQFLMTRGLKAAYDSFKQPI